MIIKKDFTLREIPGMNVVMPTGDNIRVFKGAIILNDSAAVIYKTLEKGADRNALVTALLNKFEVDEATARADVDKTIQSFLEAGIIEE